VERIRERLSAESQKRLREHRRSRQSHFVAGPLPIAWLAKAQGLGGSALAVGLACWFKARVEPSRGPVPICPDLLERFGVKRVTGYRGLLALEQAGLVSVVRHRGRCPRVSLKHTGKRGAT
jgi:hypothetical protein